MIQRRRRVLIVMAASALLAGVSNLVLRQSMAALSTGGVETDALFLGAVTSPAVLAGFLGYAVSQLLWLKVLTEARLGATFPVFVSTTFIIVMAGSVFWLDEALTVNRLIGAGLVAAGIILSERAAAPAHAFGRREVP